MSTEVPAGVWALPQALWKPQQPAWAWVRGGGGAGPRWWVVLARPQVHAAPHQEEPGGPSHLACAGGFTV